MYDMLHEKNTCNEISKYLQSVKFLQEPSGIIDSKVAEHKNLFLSEDKYFLDVLGYENPLLMIRSVILYKNYEINKRIIYKKIRIDVEG